DTRGIGQIGERHLRLSEPRKSSVAMPTRQRTGRKPGPLSVRCQVPAKSNGSQPRLFVSLGTKLARFSVVQISATRLLPRLILVLILLNPLRLGAQVVLSEF